MPPTLKKPGGQLVFEGSNVSDDIEFTPIDLALLPTLPTPGVANDAAPGSSQAARIGTQPIVFSIVVSIHAWPGREAQDDL